MANAWKVIGIIFIVLFVLETSFIVYAYKLGMKEINSKNECSYKICMLGQPNPPYDSFYYDSKISMCYCYRNNELAKQIEVTQ